MLKVNSYRDERDQIEAHHHCFLHLGSGDARLDLSRFRADTSLNNSITPTSMKPPLPSMKSLPIGYLSEMSGESLGPIQPSEEWRTAWVDVFNLCVRKGVRWTS